MPRSAGHRQPRRTRHRARPPLPRRVLGRGGLVAAAVLAVATAAAFATGGGATDRVVSLSADSSDASTSATTTADATGTAAADVAATGGSSSASAVGCDASGWPRWSGAHGHRRARGAAPGPWASATAGGAASPPPAGTSSAQPSDRPSGAPSRGAWRTPTCSAPASSSTTSAGEGATSSATASPSTAQVAARQAATGRSSAGQASSAPTASSAASTSTSGASSTTTASTTTTTTSASTSASSGAAMPTGDIAGWKQVFSDDFTTDEAEGSFPGSAYSAKWGGYDDFKTTSGAGMFATKKITSVHDGDLDIHLRTENGVALAAAPTPLINGTWAGQKYGRYSVRFKADAVSGYKLAWLLWPDSDTWSDGEVDFPEGDVGGSVNAYVHCLGNPSSNCYDASAGSSGGGWHTATTEWTASGITFFMDGAQVGHTTVSPTASMHWVLQTETGDSTPPASASGHVLIDWVSIYRPA